MKTVRNYRPCTMRASGYMPRPTPFDAPGSLVPAEPCGPTAFPLAGSEIVVCDAVVDARSLPQVPAPARDLLVHDAREPGIPFR